MRTAKLIMQDRNYVIDKIAPLFKPGKNSLCVMISLNERFIFELIHNFLSIYLIDDEDCKR